MRKLLFLLAISSIIACTTKEPITKSTLSGTVENMGEVPVLLSLGQKVDTIIVNEDGTFSITKELKKASNFMLRIGRNYSPVYLSPGYDLIANFNAEDLSGSIEFEGGLALENIYTKELAALNSELSKGMRDLYLEAPEAYKKGLMEIKNGKDNFLNSYIEENPDLCPVFAETEKLNYQFTYYSSLSNYEPAHKYYAKVEEVELPGDWYAFENEIDLDNPKYLDSPVALMVVNSIIGKRITEAGGPGDDAWGTPELLGAQFDWVLENIKDQGLTDYFLKTNITSIVDYAGPSGIEDYVTLFYEKTTDIESIEELKEKVEVWAPLTTGNDAPSFSIPDIDGNEVSLADFKGKYVYIDFWATWCGPCKIEIPVLEELAVKYADNNIEIMSISVDQDKQAWVDMVTKDQPQWLQLHDSINMNDDYLVKYIPTFVLIDRDGKILNARAPRPSSGEVLESLFNSLEGI